MTTTPPAASSQHDPHTDNSNALPHEAAQGRHLPEAAARVERGPGNLHHPRRRGRLPPAPAGASTEHVHELGYYDRKRIHNLKYYTWVEQQGKTYEEIQAQWYDDDYWTGIQALADPIDRLIKEFNRLTGLG